MSTFSKTPHLLTKEKLKNALKENDIPLPRAEQRKAFYVELYLEHLTSQNEGDEFSSDDEKSQEYSPMRASQKVPPKPPSQKIVIKKKIKDGLPFDVTALSDGDLARQIKSFGATVGPITETTRPLYQKKLAKLLAEELKQPPAPPPTKISPKQKKVTPPQPKRKEYTEFSDGNDDMTAEEMDVESVERLDSFDTSQQDQQDARPQELPIPRLSSTPSKSTPRKRVITNTVTTRQQTREYHSSDTGNNVKQTDSVEILAVKKVTPPAKEEKSFFGPRIQILLAVLVFLVFTVFLMYHLMEDAHPPGLGDEGNKIEHH